MGAHFTVPYDTEAFPLAALAAAALGVSDLQDLPERVRAERPAADRDAPLTYEENLALRAVLAGLPPDHELRVLYRQLISEVVAPRFGGHISHTRSATWRVQMAHSPGVSAWHRDADITGRPDYLTVWVPFVDTEGANTLWVETDYGSGEHAPIPVRHGEILFFDGAMLEHGSVANTTDVTRVSMDFRIVPRSVENGGPGDRGVFAGRPG